jgi:hypothetical protein
MKIHKHCMKQPEQLLTAQRKEINTPEAYSRPTTCVNSKNKIFYKHWTLLIKCKLQQCNNRAALFIHNLIKLMIASWARICGLTIKLENLPLCACHGSSGQKPQYDLMAFTYQCFTAVFLLIYGSLFLSRVYYCLSVFWCVVV